MRKFIATWLVTAAKIQNADAGSRRAPYGRVSRTCVKAQPEARRIDAARSEVHAHSCRSSIGQKGAKPPPASKVMSRAPDGFPAAVVSAEAVSAANARVDCAEQLNHQR